MYNYITVDKVNSFTQINECFFKIIALKNE